MPRAGIGSLASLSKLSGGGNAFFDPEYTPDESTLADQADESRTGLNSTARHSLALAQLADQEDALSYNPEKRRMASRTAESAFLGPEGWARTSPEDAGHARDLQYGDERIAHEAANLPTMLHMEHDRTVNAGQAKADAYWLPGTQSMLDNESRRTEEMNRSRYLDPVIERGNSAEDIARINAQSRTGAAQITANGRSNDVMNSGLAQELAAMLRRGDVNPNDPEAMTKALEGFLALRNGAASGSPGVGVPGGSGAAPGPDLSGLAPGHGRTFSSGPLTGQTWTVDASGKPQRVK